nr:hypothetical protein [Tanacetum cinerariifolium]
MSITDKSSEAKDSTLPTYDTDEVPSNKSQRNITDPLVVVSDSPAPDYVLADESLVCSTHFLPLKKLDGAEPGFGPKTVKSILKSKYMFKSKTLKGITLNEPSSAPARGNKSSSAFKTNSAPAGKLKNVNVEDDPSLAMVLVHCQKISLVDEAVMIPAEAENIQATGGPTSLGVTNEERANPQLSSVDFKAEADPGLSALNDYIPPQQDQTKSVSEGLETVLAQPIIEKGASSTTIHGDKEEASTVIHGDKEKASNTIKLEDLAKLMSQIQPSFKDLDSLEDNHSQKHKLELEKNKAKAEDALIKAQPSFLNVEQLNELLTQVHKLEIKLPKELKEIPTKLEDFTKTATGLTYQVAELKTLQWELPEEFLSLLAKVKSAQAKLKTLDALPSFLSNVIKALNKFAEVLESTSIKGRDQSVPLAGQADTMPAEGEKDTNQATISKLFQKRADKIAKAKKENLNHQLKPTPPPATTPINSPITTTTQMQTPLQSPPRSSSQPEGEHIKKDKGKKVMSSEEAEKESTETKKEGKKKTMSAKQPKSKPAVENSSKPALALKPKLVDEPDEDPAHSEHEPKLEHKGEGNEDDMELAIQMSLESFQAQSQAHVGSAASEKTNSGGDTEIQQFDEEQGKDVDDQVNLKEKKNKLDQGHARSDPGRTPESRPPPNQVAMDEDQAGSDPGKSRGALAGPDPEPTLTSLWLICTLRTLSSMKNLNDAYTIGDQFINDKSTEDEPGKLNVESEVVSMVTVPIHQASSSIPSLSTEIIDLSPPKPSSSMKAPILTAKTMTTTINLPLSPPPAQQIMSDFESRVFNMELRDLPHKIDEAVRKSVKKAIHIALQDPLRDRFRELPKDDMKEILHQRMFESGSYKLLPEHVALYEALEASMEWAQRDEFYVVKDKSCNRRRDDQDPPPPPLDSDLTWKKSDTRDAPLSSSKQQSGPHAKQPVEDLPMPETANISDSEDTDSAHLLKIKQRPEWLMPLLDDERPATLEPAGWERPSLLKQTLKAKHMKLLKLSTQTSFIFSSRWKSVTRCLLIRSGLIHKVIKSGLIKGSRQALSISKMKAARYLDFGLELLVLEHMWINEVCTYDISTSYGWDAKGFEYKHDYTIIDSPRAVVFPVGNNERKIMRFNEIYKFSDGTLMNIIEALDFRVKEYKVNRLNPGINTRFWTDKDVAKSKEFIHAIERRLKTRRIFPNLVSFVGSLVRDIDYRLLQRTE